MNETLVAKIRQCPSLPSLPSIALQVLELAQKEQADIAEIARIITKDPALSSKILRTVNSSFYGRSQSVSTISHALVILGLQSVKTLVLGFSLVGSLTKGKGFKHLAYWRRSIYSATAARCLATKLGVVQQEECFLAALLMDIGMLVLDQVVGEEYGAIVENVSSHNDLSKAEQAALGITHAQASGVLADQWKLPPVLSGPMKHHDNPAAVTDASLKRLAEVTWLAGRCADVFQDPNAAGAIADVRAHCKGSFQMVEPACDALLDEIGKRTREIAPLFEINLANARSFEDILKKANETLVDLTLRTQQQAVNLEQQNLKLKEQATTDALTGLANRAKLDQFLGEQFALALRSAKVLSVIMLDLDKFKTVNDRYGHQTGDQVLRAIGALLKSAARAQDLAARYGGEEMVLVLPGTTRPTAAAVAESIRRAIAAKPIKCGNAALPVTASLGVATFEPGGPLRESGHLLKAADMGVYAAKSAGRNCVKIFALKTKAA
jgi:diguanylate cyclase (GGDEF)-like protein